MSIRKASTNRQSFFGRKQEKRKLIEAVLADIGKSSKSWAVLGNRGVGKTETMLEG